MQITELDKLHRDLEQLTHCRDALQQLIDDIGASRRTTARWIMMTLTRIINLFKMKMERKSQEIANAEAEERIRKARGANGTKREHARRDKNDGAGNSGSDISHRQLPEAGRQQECQRIDAAQRVRGLVVADGAVREVAAGTDAGAGSGETDGGTAEACLRARYRDRNRDALRDWQREVMEANQEGRREPLIL